ncbi:MAG: hypothetical protein ACLR6J_09365 [Parabacteroides merdae]
MKEGARSFGSEGVRRSDLIPSWTIYPECKRSWLGTTTKDMSLCFIPVASKL